MSSEHEQWKQDLEKSIRDIERRKLEAAEAIKAGQPFIADILLHDYRPVGKYVESLHAQLADVNKRLAETGQGEADG